MALRCELPAGAKKTENLPQNRFLDIWVASMIAAKWKGGALLPALARLPDHRVVMARGACGDLIRNAELKPVVASSHFPLPAAAGPPRGCLERWSKAMVEVGQWEQRVCLPLCGPQSLEEPKGVTDPHPNKLFPAAVGQGGCRFPIIRDFCPESFSAD